MNLNVWDSMPGSIQKTLDKVSAEVMEKGIITSNDYLFGAREKALTELGMEEIWLTPDEEARWMEKLQTIDNNWVAKIDSKGLSGKKILDTVKDIAEKNAKKYPGPKLR